MTLSTRLRLKHYATPKPYLIYFGPHILEHDPLTGKTYEVGTRELGKPNVFDYNDPDGMLHIRPAGDMQRTPRPK